MGSSLKFVSVNRTQAGCEGVSSVRSMCRSARNAAGGESSDASCALAGTDIPRSRNPKTVKKAGSDAERIPPLIPPNGQKVATAAIDSGRSGALKFSDNCVGRTEPTDARSARKSAIVCRSRIEAMVAGTHTTLRMQVSPKKERTRSWPLFKFAVKPTPVRFSVRRRPAAPGAARRASCGLQLSHPRWAAHQVQSCRMQPAHP